MELDRAKKYKVTFRRFFDGERWVTKKIYTEVNGEGAECSDTSASTDDFFDYITYLLNIKAKEKGFRDMVTAKAYANTPRYARYYTALSLDKWSVVVWNYIYALQKENKLPRKREEWDSALSNMPPYEDIEPKYVEMYDTKFSVNMLDVWLRQHAEYQKDSKKVVVVDINGNPLSLTTTQSNKLQKEVGKIINLSKKNRDREIL